MESEVYFRSMNFSSKTIVVEASGANGEKQGCVSSQLRAYRFDD